LINTNLSPYLAIAILGYPSCVQPPQRKGSLYTLYHILVSDISLKLDTLRLHFSCREFRYIFNRFYAVRPGSYRIRWNSAK